MTDDHLKQLGRVAANFQGHFFGGDRIRVLDVDLIGPDQKVGQMVTVQLPFGKLCVLARTLFSYRFPDSPYARKFTDLDKTKLET